MVKKIQSKFAKKGKQKINKPANEKKMQYKHVKHGVKTLLT